MPDSRGYKSPLMAIKICYSAVRGIKGDMDDLTRMRERIDVLDGKIVQLLEERMHLTDAIGRLKQGSGACVRDAGREQAIIDGLSKASTLESGFIKALYQEIFAESRRRQIDHDRSASPKKEAFQPGKTDGTVAVLGPEKTFSALAAERLFSAGKTVRFTYCDSFDDVFAAVVASDADYGVVAVENSLEGSVNRVLDLLLSHDVAVVGESVADIHLCLVASRGESLDTIERVASHPHALAQCAGFLGKSLPNAESEPASSTAAAAMRALEEKGLAAIAPRQAAEAYGLSVLACDIEDDASQTRFLVIGRDRQETGTKTSIIFAVADEPGSLYDALRLFADAGINLSKIESRPSRRQLGEYLFYVDFEGELADDGVARVLSELGEKASFLKVLGSY